MGAKHHPFYWNEAEVATRLEEMMVAAFHRVYEMSQRQQVDLTAAYGGPRSDCRSDETTG